MIMFVDYIEGDVKWILESLKMSGKVDTQLLMGLMDLDFSLDSRTTSDIYMSPGQASQRIGDITRSSDLLAKRKKNINRKWVFFFYQKLKIIFLKMKIGIILSKGNFGLLRKCVDEFYCLKMP